MGPCAEDEGVFDMGIWLASLLYLLSLLFGGEVAPGEPLLGPDSGESAVFELDGIVLGTVAPPPKCPQYCK